MYRFRGCMGSSDILKNEIESILFNIGKDIKIHRIDGSNTIIEIDYDKYVTELLNLFNKYQSSI